jgi:major vault protein
MLEEAREVIRDRGPKKMSITNREFVWVQSDDGEVTLLVGPCMVSPTATDRIVVDDGDGGFEDAPERGHTQRMVEVGDNQYAVLFNPLEKPDAGSPNGTFKSARNETRPLRNGTKQMIPGPCSFYLRPGQRCEVRDAHELGSNQYLVVKAYGEVDEEAPYYDITARSAGVTSTTIREGEDVREEGSTPAEHTEFQRGGQIVIRGIDTQFYIPPTGLDIVPDTSFDDSGASISGEEARELLQQAVFGAIGTDPNEYKTSGGIMLSADAATRGFESTSTYASSGVPIAANYSGDVVHIDKPASRGRRSAVEQAARKRHRVQREAGAYQALLSNAARSPALQAEMRRRAGQTRLVRDAVVLTEKEFCVIIDADGRRNVKVGPARVFPGPYDTFMTRGSRNRIYDAYELLPQRALWLRVITRCSKQQLQERLPAGSSSLLTKENYHPGDEILLRDINAFFFPFNEIEVLCPETGQSHVGNDHENVLLEAIGIDQKSGIYVRDLETGAAKLIRGKRSYLVDPAREVHISRIVSAIDWNHWVTAFRKHKQVNQPVVTPWALSIRIPHNMAVLATSAVGQRVIEGPCVELLEYEEKLAYLELSTSTPKVDSRTLQTCFLQTSGNRVSDVVRVETLDFVEIDVRVTYRVTFEQEFKDRWFNHNNYVQLLAEHTRSLIRNHCRSLPLADLWLNLASVVRDLILGDKDPETGERPGRLFEENGMRIVEVEVLDTKVLDAQISDQFTNAQRKIVSLQIGNREAEAKLEAHKIRDRIDTEEQRLKEQEERRRSTINDLIRNLRHTAVMADMEVEQDRVTNERAFQNEDAARQVDARLHRQRVELESELRNLLDAAEANAESTRKKNAAEVEFKDSLTELEGRLIKSRSDATVAENGSITPGLVEALTALGDKQLLTEAAQNMNLISLFKGRDVGQILTGVFGGTKVVKTLGDMRDRAKALVSKNRGLEGLEG